MAADRDRRHDHLLHRQDRGGTEHPHVVDPGGRRRIAFAHRVDPRRDGRYRAHALRRRHVWQPLDARHGSAASTRGGDRPGGAARLGGGALVGGSGLADGGGRQGSACLQPTLHRLRGTDAGAETGSHHFVRDDSQTRDAVERGRHRYASDMVRPGMLFGRVLRPPSYGATLDSLETSRAAAMPGVRVVRDGDFVGVVAPSSHVAAQAVAALKATWKTRAQPSEGQLFQELRGGATPLESGLVREPDGGLALKRTYTIAYIAHVPLEPRAAVAEWKDGKLTVWTGSQRPFGIRDSELTKAFGLGPERLRVIVPDTGSGYGGKHTGLAAVEAARLARAVDQPVKIIWTREEEFTWAYFRPAGVIDIASRVRADGTLATWDFHNYNSGSAGIEPPYAIPDPQTKFHRADSPLPQGSYRSLAAAANHFARESHIDELAGELKIDPLEFRLRNIKNPRLLAVVDSAARAFGWG